MPRLRERVARLENKLEFSAAPPLPDPGEFNKNWPHGFLADAADVAWAETISKFDREKKLRILREEAEKDDKVMDHLLRLLLKHQMV